MPAHGYHASHQRFPPGESRRLVGAAGQAGFTRAMCSDHFAPFGAEQGQSGFARSWLGAAPARTGLPPGVVDAPGQRAVRRVVGAYRDGGARVLPELA
ncbi:hypothetical protein O7622_16700 [Micromonospora sp. WMMD1076]|uniref:hypothetical protein n=1 Tax=Micromonospora sp. WMMD1076 TaxID=3016103 RepID=UPI00249CD159|nr:hypothetical protein [Micromonospora sp. WMMD1076]WFF04715.1 hypothetical protein O7622_16700 [Micromonospora sp. WMMD1076]